MLMMILHFIFNRFMAPACFHLHWLKAEEAAENIEEEEKDLLKLSPPESAEAANCGTTSPSTKPFDCIAPRTIDQLEMHFFFH
ncbi:unnamed protein product [Sphagnum troendelagicum]|uniref:Uncharacterized protein n=1 Tax=Sphagnum troendelagicum TaxID=128251 RepID=A0ABP0U0P3_9BRYO